MIRHAGGGEPWDRDALVQALGGDVELAAELIEIFAGECPRLMDGVRRALESADADGLRRAAHALKGSVANFTTAGAHAAAAELERLARLGDISSAAEAMAQLEREIAALLFAMASPREPEQRCAS